ncbi:MAG: Asp-tRNA(Asn)/Glu-tRNA(Gln) amidotransferase subunit GatC [Verrucomicrobiales bacterium]
MSSGKLSIHHVARLARLELTAEEAALFEKQLEPILGLIDKLSDLGKPEDEPLPEPPPGLPPVREDEPVIGLENSPALSNAPAQARGQFQVPRVIDAE